MNPGVASPSLAEFGYEEIKVIGRGQYGLVHLVRSIKEQSLYVCKTIDLTCLSEKERETAKQEVELLRRLDHQNIVDYKDNFLIGNAIVIAMQYCEGGDIATYIKEMARRRTRIKEAQIMSWFVQTLLALEYVHGMRVLHRDLKTSNLFLTEKVTVVKLGDFGISRQFAHTQELANSVVGTPHYMSPEVCENKPYTFKSDVWSLGCVLYELCMLKHCFAADNLLGLVHKIVSGKYESIPPMYSANLNLLIQRMLTRNTTLRPSIKALLDDKNLQGYVATASRGRGSGSPSPPATRSGTRGRPGAAAKPARDGSPVRSQPAAKGGAQKPGAKPRASKQKTTAGDRRHQAWGLSQDKTNALPGEKANTTAGRCSDEEYYEDDFCSEDAASSDPATDSDWDEGDMELGVLSPVYEDVHDLDTMSAAGTIASAYAGVGVAAAAATGAGGDFAGGRESSPHALRAAVAPGYGGHMPGTSMRRFCGAGSSSPTLSAAPAPGYGGGIVKRQQYERPERPSIRQQQGLQASTAASRAGGSPPNPQTGTASRNSGGAASSGNNWSRGGNVWSFK